MKKLPSRVLNENSLLFGLNQTDLLGIGCIFYLLQTIFHPFGLGVVSIVLTMVFFVFLVGIRLKYRRRIIRDSFSYFYIKIFRGGVYDDPSFDKKI